MKLKIVLTLSLLLGFIANVSAVTDGEMEQARAITAKNYLRWVNNGSGYLDDVKELPKSMADLKKVLKAKELENLKKFESVSTPKDYASWDKTKLVAYWSDTFLSSPGLDPVGKGSRSRTVKHLNQMTVSAPAKEAPKADEKPESKPEAEKPAADGAKPEETTPGSDRVSDEIAGQMAAGEQIVAEEQKVIEEATDEDTPRQKKSNGTWIYVGILVALVIVVVVLVIYAARASKSGEEDPDDSDELGSSERRGASSRSNDNHDEVPSYQPGDTVTRKEHEFMIERKNEKIRKVKAELDVVREENARLQATVDSLQTRLSQAQTQVESLRIARTESGAAPAQAETTARPVRSLYLGRVNRSGLFVRADRQLNPEATVYRLDTEDGYTGSFRVVNTPAVIDRVLDNPEQWLETGCSGKDLMDTDGVSEIVTESSGTAVLENGCWKMIRKAKIQYI